MKRDMELIRKLLLYVEAHDTLPEAESINADPADLVGHVGLLIEAGLLAGVSINRLQGGAQGVILDPWPRLSWQGQEFIAAARDLSTWEKAQEILGGAGKGLSNVTLGVLQALLVKILSGGIGLQ